MANNRSDVPDNCSKQHDHDIEKKLEDLRREIERVRTELHDSAEDKGYAFTNEETNRVSSKLDKLIVQFMRLKSKMD